VPCSRLNKETETNPPGRRNLVWTNMWPSPGFIAHHSHQSKQRPKRAQRGPDGRRADRSSKGELNWIEWHGSTGWRVTGEKEEEEENKSSFWVRPSGSAPVLPVLTELSPPVRHQSRSAGPIKISICTMQDVYEHVRGDSRQPVGELIQPEDPPLLPEHVGFILCLRRALQRDGCRGFSMTCHQLF